MYIDKKYSENEYLCTFNRLIEQFKPRPILMNLIPSNLDKFITIHLQRTDEALTNDVNSENSIPLSELTKYEIAKYKCSNEGIKLYFISDCPVIKSKYEEEYPDHLSINKDFSIISESSKSIISTYVDIYLMSISNCIILSQKHSSFSLFSSLINHVKLIYFYHNSIIHRTEYYKFNHIKYYKED